MRKWLSAVCIVFTAVVVLLVVVNAIAAAWLGAAGRRIEAQHPVFDEATRATYERIYQLPIATVRQIVSESWPDEPWIFEPYVQFRERPRAGRHVNVAPDGFRQNSADGRRAFDPGRPGAVFIFGGSTAFGYGVRDEDTVAAHLEAALQRAQPAHAGRVAVYNFGRGYYGSSQEVLLLKSLLQRGQVPAVAVFIDGVNEQFCPTYSANIAETFRIIQHDPRAQLRAAAAALPVVRMLGGRRASELTVNALELNRELAGYSFECGCPAKAACPAQFLRMFTLNKRVALAMAEELGFQAHFVLQPVGGYRNAFTTNPDGTPRMDRAALWHELERHTVRGPHDHSFTGILEHYRGDAFVDALHYTAGVHRLIAERLYPIVAPAVMAAATR